MKSPGTQIETRWAAIEAMSAEDFAQVAASVSVCLSCRGPALLEATELELVIAEPRCRRCRQAVAA